MIMEGLLSGKLLMPGFRFHPSDEVLFMFYLKRKVLGKRFKCEMMAEVDVNQFAPWDLPAMSLLKTKDLYWYFFCPRAKKYPNGGRANRATGCGYWKSTGNDRSVKYNSKIVGRIKTLIFHTGKAPKGERTNWVMHEYKLEDSVVAEHGVSGDSYVICKIYEKSGLGPKNGQDYGAPFVEEEWESDDDCDNSGLSLQDLGCDGGRGSPDGFGSVLTSGTSNVAPLATTPIVSTAATANIGSANMNSVTVGIPYATAATVSTPYTTAATVSSDTAAFISMADASGDTVIAFADGAGAASNNADPVFQDEEIDGLLLSGDEIDKIEELLANFTEGHSEDLGEIFEGLGNLQDSSAHSGIDWSDVLEMNDLE